MFAVAIVLRELGYDRPLDQIDPPHLHSIQMRLVEKPSFEIHVSRAPCRVCVKFVCLISGISGLPMIIRVGAIVAESQEPTVFPKSLWQRTHDSEDHRGERERFGPVPPEWPEELRQVFAVKDGGVQRGATLSAVPMGSTSYEGESGEDRTASEGTVSAPDAQESRGEGNQSNGGAGADDGDDYVQEIDGYTYHYWSARHSPDTPIPSIEEDEHDPRCFVPGSPNPQPETREHTATTPDGSPLAVSPRTHMFIRGKKYGGPTYMPRSPIHKPRPTPIWSTPSDIRKRQKSPSTVSGDEGRCVKRARNDDGGRGQRVAGERIDSDFFGGRGDEILYEVEQDLLV